MKGLLFFALWSVATHQVEKPERVVGPYARQVADQLDKLNSTSPLARAAAAEALGFLRAYEAEDALIGRLRDPSERVRREASMALGWCGSRRAVDSLLAALTDTDWVTRQAAHVSLTNLTGMEFPFDSLATLETRAGQVQVWRAWWDSVPQARPPRQVLDLLAGPDNFGSALKVTASTTYKGPPSVLCDGLLGPEFWQTKNVPFPQWCTIDLGRPQEIAQVTIHQYGPAFVMTEYSLATSSDGKRFDVVERKSGVTPVVLRLRFSPRTARYVRVTSFGSKRPTYPTTFFEIEVGPADASRRIGALDYAWRWERGFRALGVLGGTGATEAILEKLGTPPPAASPYRPMVLAAIRALGRLGDEAGFQRLLALLDSTTWARDAADALADTGDRRAVSALLAAYPRYAKQLDGRDPPLVPRDDKMTFPSEDRMLETPFRIAYALGRLPIERAEDLQTLRSIAPQVMANLPGDHDTFFLYEPEVGHLLTRHLMDTCGLRQEACDHALKQLSRPRRSSATDTQDTAKWPVFSAGRLSSWLPAVCTDPKDVPRVLPLLEHEDGWVRLNAAKTLAWLGDPRAIAPLARLLRDAPAEAEYGYSGTFKDEEYADPAPRWREGLIRALGLLGAHEHTALIVSILEDENSVLEVRHAAVQALADLGDREALDAARRAASKHPFHSIRHVARDALRSLGRDLAGERAAESATLATRQEPPGTSSPATPAPLQAVVFIKGNNNLPNTLGTVEQADRWRQTYVVTDSGPAYRPGRNLYVLEPASPDGEVRRLTQFEDGFVAELEVSWDATEALFTRRGEKDPWWHIFRIRLDGSSREQLTHGPYHHVGPAYLPDGRIVFASSRGGIRDEYHGYPCTPLYVMNADGSDIHPIATNIGRDNEPAVLLDGRIVFSRLEVFYSRNKTELTLHAAHPDGSQDMVLYGPERREFWYRLDHGPRTPADGQENPQTHRVLRMTQPQPMPNGQDVVVVTQGGLALVGRSRVRETIITKDNKRRAYTTPFPLPDGRLLCASTLKTPDRNEVDLGLYLLDPATGDLKPVYNDPQAADFEPRPVAARRRPPVIPSVAGRSAYSGRFLCASVFTSREPQVAKRGRLVRLIEGMPVVSRHSTQTNPEPVWKNHGGTLARVLGTAPLASDGSFFIEVPADRLLHLQVLDSNRRVVGNQLTWVYARPRETRSCVGCHEAPNTVSGGRAPQASGQAPLEFLPTGDEFRYRAKAWFKGHLPAKIEERTRTARAVNLLAR